MDNSLFSEEMLNATIADNAVENKGPVKVLGMEFANDDERRAYFREELRKKLPELKQIEGFPIGEDDDIINLSDPPYYTACPNPWLNDFIAEWEKEKNQIERQNKDVSEPYASDVSEGKFDPLYMYHPYLTKVPHKAVQKYIDHYTQSGDIILDGFAGTGMTGAAARLSTPLSRKCICVDLSPLASFIDYCVNSIESGNSFANRVSTIINEVESQLGWMFKTHHTNGAEADINYVLWSDVYVCPHCGQELVYWNTSVDKERGKILGEFNCTNCSTALTKSNLNKAQETKFSQLTKDVITSTKRVPVLINYTCAGKRYEKMPDAHDLEILKTIDTTEITTWFPTDKTYEGDELSRASRDGISYFFQYYTQRVLSVLSAIKDRVSQPLDNYLITKLAFQNTLMYRYTYMNGCWGAGGGPMSGTLYVPSLIKEINVFKQLKECIHAREKIQVADNASDVIISTQSSSSLVKIPSSSIDYIFTDPPFGSNLMYSELNYLSEMWLKVLTNNDRECIVSKTQNKSLPEYQDLMTRVFDEYYRVLKPGKWFSIEFSNTSASVWTCIQNAIQSAGFIVANVSALDKQKGSFKAVTTTTAVKQDLVISCYKPTNQLISNILQSCNQHESAWDFVEEYLLHLPVHIERNQATTTIVERTPKVLFDRLISYFVQKNLPVPMDASQFQNGIRERFEESDGMFFTAGQISEYFEKKKLAPDFIPMGLIVSNEADGIEWLRNRLRVHGSQTYQQIQPEWMQAINGLRKNDILPELKDLLYENFIEEADGKWRLPNVQDDVDKAALRTKALLKEFKIYVEVAQKPKAKLKEVRVEAVRAGFKQCYIDKDFQTIVMVGDKIPQNLLTEDEILLQFYDIAVNHV